MGVDVQDGKPPVVVGEGWQRRTDLLLASSSVQTRLALNRMRVAQECLLQPDNGVFKFPDNGVFLLFANSGVIIYVVDESLHAVEWRYAADCRGSVAVQ